MSNDLPSSVTDPGSSPASNPVGRMLERRLQSRANKLLEQLNQLSEFWHMGQEPLTVDGDEAAQPWVMRPRHLRRLEPGSPVPHDVDPAATRYEIVIGQAPPRRWRVPGAAAGTLVMLGGVAGLAKGGVLL